MVAAGAAFFLSRFFKEAKMVQGVSPIVTELRQLIAVALTLTGDRDLI